MVIASEWVRSSEHPVKLLYQLVNGIERALRSNLAQLSVISSFWTLFVGIYATKRKSCTGVPWRPFNCCCTVTPTFATSFIFIPTYHSLHVCSHQALLCTRLAACHVPLVFAWAPVIFTWGQAWVCLGVAMYATGVNHCAGCVFYIATLH